MFSKFAKACALVLMVSLTALQLEHLTAAWSDGTDLLRGLLIGAVTGIIFILTQEN